MDSKKKKKSYLLQTKYYQTAYFIYDDSVRTRLNLKANQHTEESPAQNKSLYIEVIQTKNT